MLRFWKTGLAATAAAALFFCFNGCSKQAVPPLADGTKESSDPVAKAGKEEKERKPAPDFTLADHTGARLQLSSLKGKVVLLNFWATWCGPCKVEIPWFMEFHQTYKDRDLVIVGVSLDEDGWTSVKPYIDDKKINYRIVVGNDEVATKYGGVEAMPYTVMIDKAGKIAFKHTGLDSKSNYKKEIEQLLNDTTANLAIQRPGAL